MPLPEPAPRLRHAHTRQIVCEGFQRDDGLWDIEAHITDTKPHVWHNDAGMEMKAGQPYHDMWIRLTVDEELLVHEAIASTDAAPYPACPSVPQRFGEIVGLRMVGGWRDSLRRLFGKDGGCTHLTELLTAMGTVAIQAIYAGKKLPEGTRPFYLGTCHAWSLTGDMVTTHYPQYAAKRDA